MTRLNLNHFGLTSIILIVTLQMTCSTKNKNNELVSSIQDTLNYGEKDYELMREYFNSDSLIISRMTKGISVGDTNLIKIKKLLTTEYESRDKIGLTDSEIDAMILSYYTAKKAINRFNEIDKILPQTDAEAIRAKTDSIVNALETIKEDLKNN